MAEDSRVIELLGELVREADTQISTSATSAEVSWLVCHFLMNLALEDDAECDKLCDWTDASKEARCKMIGEHVWTHDHCGMWHHKFCEGCGKSKYPEIRSLGCGEFRELHGALTEEGYEATKCTQ